MSNPTIALSTKAGYPVTYISSEAVNIEGWDAFISVDYRTEPYPATGKGGSGKPEIHLVGFTISLTKLARPAITLSIGDQVTIGDTVYTLTATRKRFTGNGDLHLVPTV